MFRPIGAREFWLALLASVVFGMLAWAVASMLEAHRLLFWLPGDVAGRYSTQGRGDDSYEQLTLDSGGKVMRTHCRKEGEEWCSDPAEEGTWHVSPTGRIVLRWSGGRSDVARVREETPGERSLVVAGKAYHPPGPVIRDSRELCPGY